MRLQMTPSRHLLHKYLPPSLCLCSLYHKRFMLPVKRRWNQWRNSTFFAAIRWIATLIPRNHCLHAHGFESGCLHIMHTYIHTCIHITHAYISHIHRFIHTHLFTHTHTCIQTFIHTYTHTSSKFRFNIKRRIRLELEKHLACFMMYSTQKNDRFALRSRVSRQADFRIIELLNSRVLISYVSGSKELFVK